MIDLTGFLIGVDLVECTDNVLPMRGLKDGKEFVYHWCKHPYRPNTFMVSAELLAQIKEYRNVQRTLSTGG